MNADRIYTRKTLIILSTAAAFLCMTMVTLHFVRMTAKTTNENDKLKREMELVTHRLDKLDNTLAKIGAASGDLDQVTRSDVEMLESRTGIDAEHPMSGSPTDSATETPTSDASQLDDDEAKGIEIDNASTDKATPMWDVGPWSGDAMVVHPLDRINELTVNANLLAHKIVGLTSAIESRKTVVNTIPSMIPTTGRITSGFGFRNSPFTGKRSMHRGIDIATKKGTKVLAPADGKVLYSGWGKSFGRVLVINHGYGIVTKFAHNSKLMVQQGERVKRGQTIATVGSTGRSTGSHLHYEVWVNGKAVNPERFLLDQFDSVIVRNADDSGPEQDGKGIRLASKESGGMGGDFEFAASNYPGKQGAQSILHWEQPLNLVILACYCLLSAIILTLIRGRRRSEFLPE